MERTRQRLFAELPQDLHHRRRLRAAFPADDAPTLVNDAAERHPPEDSKKTTGTHLFTRSLFDSSVT